MFMSEFSLLVRLVGLEPTSLAALVPKTNEFANFSTDALFISTDILIEFI